LNFKLLIILIFISSCGLKTKPKAKSPSEIKKIEQVYIDAYKKDKDSKKKEKK